MSRMYFHSQHGEAEVRGRERVTTMTTVTQLPLPTAPAATDTAERIAHLEAIIASKRTNNGRAAWARAELKRLRKEK